MKKLPNLVELGKRLAKIDLTLITLLKTRSEITRQVAQYKIATGKKFVRLGIERQRINMVRKWAKAHGMNPDFAQQIMYSIINESCKQQLVELQTTIRRPLPTLSRRGRGGEKRFDKKRMS